MLVINVLKGMKRKPIRIIGIISLIMFASLLYVALFNTMNMVEKSLYKYVEEYNQEDFSFEMNMALSNDEVSEALNRTNYASDIRLLQDLTDDDRMYFINKRIVYLQDKYDIQIEKREYKQLSFNLNDKKVNMRIFKNNQTINKTYVEGNLPVKDDEIALSKSFMKYNDLSIGDHITIKDKNYEIVGRIYMVDYIYPQLSNESMLFDAKTQTLAVLSDLEFDAFNEIKITYFSGEFTNGIYDEDKIEDLKDNYMTQVIGARNAFRTGAIYSEVDHNKTMIMALTGSLLFLGVIIIGIVVNKSLNTERSQIGVIKSLGYSNLKILKAYMVYPLVASIVGTLLGLVLGYIASNPLLSVFDQYYQMPFGKVTLDLDIILRGLIFTIGVINIFSAFVIYFIVRKKPLDLIRIKNNNRINFLVRLSNKLLKKLNFMAQFKYSVALRSIGKLFVTFVGVLVASIYMVFAISGLQSFDTVIGDSIGDSDYKYQVTFQRFINDEVKASDDRFMTIPSNLLIEDEHVEVTLYGIEEDLERLDLGNKELLTKLYENEHHVIITKMLSESKNINVGETIQITTPHKETKTLKVIGIVDNYMNSNIYMQIKTVNGYLNLPDDYYNGLWTKEKIEDERILTIFDKDDMVRAMEEMTKVAKTTIYFMIFVSSVLALIVLVLIANFNIEDNFKMISFLKVMGYHNKEVSNMVLNVYFPFVVIAYLVSIPLTIASLNQVMETISEQLNFVLPFAMNFYQGCIGLVIISFTYYASMLISKRKLSKISLQESLKYNE